MINSVLTKKFETPCETKARNNYDSEIKASQDFHCCYETEAVFQNLWEFLKHLQWPHHLPQFLLGYSHLIPLNRETDSASADTMVWNLVQSPLRNHHQKCLLVDLLAPVDEKVPVVLEDF